MKRSLKARQLKNQISDLTYLIFSDRSSEKEKDEVKKRLAYMLKKWKESKAMS